MLFRRLSSALRIGSNWKRSAHLDSLKTPLKRQTHHGEVFYKGQNLPFSIHNHRLFAIKFVIFLAIPYFIPFYMVRYHLLKATGGGGGAGGAAKASK